MLGYLKTFKFLDFEIQTGAIAATLLGKAAFASSIPPEHSIKIFDDLREARGNLVLENDLHLLYLVTPHFKQLREPNWEVFIHKFRKLTKAERAVADFYSLNMEYLYKAAVYPPKLPLCLVDASSLASS